VAVPIGVVHGIEGGIRLTLTKQEVEHLPVVELDHQGGLRTAGDAALPVDGVLGGDPEAAKEDADDEVIVPNRSGIDASGAVIDEILDHWADRERQWAEQRLEVKAERERFLQDFKEISRTTIKPAMEAVVQRSKRTGVVGSFGMAIRGRRGGRD
jgi:hypothetical protein